MRARYRLCKLCGELHSLAAWPDNHRELPPQRSMLASPSVIRDGLDDLFHLVDSKIYDSKRAFRKTTDASGNYEVGTEVQKDRRVFDEVTAADVATAVQMVEQGHVPHPADATPEDMTSII